jgi:hypothetical protein
MKLGAGVGVRPVGRLLLHPRPGAAPRYWEQHVHVHPEYADLGREMRELIADLRNAVENGTPIDDATQARVDRHKSSFENQLEYHKRRAGRHRNG